MPFKIGDFQGELWALETDRSGDLKRATEGDAVVLEVDRQVIDCLKSALDNDPDAELKAECMLAELGNAGQTAADITFASYPWPD